LPQSERRVCAAQATVTRESHDAVPVLTVDDYLPFHTIARQLVDATPGFVSAGEVASGREAYRVIESREPGLVLMDVHMPDMDGIAVARWIRCRHHTVVVVLISTDEPAALPSAAFECGAATVLRKQDLRPSVLADLWRTHGRG
jgi:DNA-binding NarL/FixJ family response regulator